MAGSESPSQEGERSTSRPFDYLSDFVADCEMFEWSCLRLRYPQLFVEISQGLWFRGDIMIVRSALPIP